MAAELHGYIENKCEYVLFPILGIICLITFFNLELARLIHSTTVTLITELSGIFSSTNVEICCLSQFGLYNLKQNSFVLLTGQNKM